MSNAAEQKAKIFSRRESYPNASGIFSFLPKTLEEVKDDCLIVIDTNSLLIPYRTGQKSLEQIELVYRPLIDANRLFIPAHVAREFADQRAKKLQELYQQIQRKRDKDWKVGQYPLLESVDIYRQLLELEGKLSSLMQPYHEMLDNLLSEIRSWHWNDPVSGMYRRLFQSDAVIECTLADEQVVNRVGRSISDKVPPGYKDGAKDDNQGGDVIIWLTILELAEKHQKSLIFVSDEEKTDWTIKSEGRVLYTRYELVGEFAQHSGGQTFHLCSFSNFLKLYNAPTEVVREIRSEETVFISKRTSLPNVSPRLIRSWFDQVINPLISMLDQTWELLETSEWTWRVPPGDLNLIWPFGTCRGLVIETLEQMLKFFPDLRIVLEQYDIDRRILLEACRNLQEMLENLQELGSIYDEISRDTSMTQQGYPLNNILVGRDKKEHIAILAQYIVNRSRELQSSYTYAPIWNRYQDQFFSTLKLPAFKDAEELICNAGRKLQNTVLELRNSLNGIRHDLSIDSGEPIF